jgi:hypothetical protein
MIMQARVTAVARAWMRLFMVSPEEAFFATESQRAPRDAQRRRKLATDKHGWTRMMYEAEVCTLV